ncbi:Uncharacterised protein [Sphingobacterium multivorum]|uniref:Uncharacterized protein n=1 Tax=Sphingobacterium multivorum TaxID=28454 RepID=A0A2X2LCE7_SPHMU|nr:Uncharacterised protein [Sphingobacterium multivorum]
MPLQFNTVKLFAGSGTTELAEKIAQSYGKPLGDKTLSRLATVRFNHSTMNQFAEVMYSSSNLPTNLPTIFLNYY